MDIQKGDSVETLLFACSGGSNVGQIANDVCRELTKDGTGKLYCLAGIGGHIQEFLNTAKLAQTIVVIDGCGVKCTGKVMEEHSIPVSQHIVLTEVGIEKNANLYPDMVVVQTVKEHVKERMK